MSGHKLVSIMNLIHEGYRLLQHNRWPRERILRFSEERFSQVVKFAFSEKPFYRDLYRAWGIREADLPHLTPQDLPIITKDDVRGNFERIAPHPVIPSHKWAFDAGDPASKSIDDYILVHSSGSTGKPCNFLYDERAMTAVEANMIRISMLGKNSITLRDFPIRVLYVASVGSGYASTALALSGIEKYGARSVILNVQDPWETWVDRIQRFNPNYLGGYPSCIKLIADLQKEGRICIHPKKIITGGEPLSEETSWYLQKTFGADIIDYYACTESLVIGIGMNSQKGLYLFDDMNYCEVDEHNRLIITPLYNRAFPLIRYRLDDMVEGFNRQGTGALPYTYIDRILGRDEEIMWFRNGEWKWDFLHPLFLDDLDVPGIKQYQFVQTGETSLVIRVVGEPEIPEQELRLKISDQMNSFLARKNLGNIRYSVEFCESLKTDPLTGKTKLVEKAAKISP